MKKNILICDFASGGGHHPSFVSSMANSLLNLGFNAIITTPFNSEIKGIDTDDNCICFFAPQKSLLYNSIDSIFKDKFSQLKNWLLLNQTIRKYQSRHGKIDCIMMADGNNFFPSTSYNVKLFRNSLSIPVVVIPHFFDYRRPQSPKEFTESLVSTGMASMKFIKGCLMLDEELCEIACKCNTSIKFEFLPDVRKIIDNPNHGTISTELFEFANGRKIILLCGALDPRKGLIKFLNLAQEKEFENCVFAAIGHLDLLKFNHEERLFIEQCNNNLKNLFLHFKKIDSNEEFMKLISDSNIVYSVYLNFERNSGIIPLAVSYKIPVLSSSVHSIGYVMQKYNIGECANPSNYLEIKKKLLKLLAEEKSGFDFKSFDDDYSHNRYEENMFKIISAVVQR